MTLSLHLPPEVASRHLLLGPTSWEEDVVIRSNLRTFIWPYFTTQWSCYTSKSTIHVFFLFQISCGVDLSSTSLKITSHLIMWSCWCQEIDCEERKGDSSPSRLFQKLYFVENRASTTVSNMALWPSFFCITNSLRIPDKQVLTGMLSFLYKIPSSTAQTHLNLQQETQSLVHRQMIFWQECPEENFFLT